MARGNQYEDDGMVCSLRSIESASLSDFTHVEISGGADEVTVADRIAGAKGWLELFETELVSSSNERIAIGAKCRLLESDLKAYEATAFT
jgi:hypothetical protein